MSAFLVVFLLLLAVAFGLVLMAAAGAFTRPVDTTARVVGRRHDPNERRIHSTPEPGGGAVVVDLGPTWVLEVELMGQRFAVRVTQAQFDAYPNDAELPVRVWIGPFGPTDVQALPA
jgi:hypothetical protein